MANGKTKTKKTTKMWKFRGRWPFMGWRKKTKNSWEYTRSTAAFSATLHAARREVQVCTLITHGEHLTKYRLLTARAYKSRLCLISGGPLAPPIQPLPLPALSFRHLLNSFYQFPANLLLRWPSHNSSSFRSHRTTTAAPVAIA